MTSTAGSDRRPGAETRAEILRVALRLFTEKGFEGTSTRDISSALGLTKSSLYYHFQNKEAIVLGLMQERLHELDSLIDWITAQPPTPDLVRKAALRWVESTTPERLQLMRLAHANQPLMRRFAESGSDVRTGFDRVIDLFVSKDATPEDRLYTRMVFDTISAALLAAQGTQASPDDVIAAARRAIIALTRSDI
jgi:AcrR family transcriptional regulator